MSAVDQVTGWPGRTTPRVSRTTAVSWAVAPTGIGGSVAGVMVTLPTAVVLTVSAISPILPLVVVEMVADPTAMPMTRPFSSTAVVVGFVDDQRNDR